MGFGGRDAIGSAGKFARGMNAAEAVHSRRDPNPMSRLSEVRWIDLPSIEDPRGELTAVESEQDLPFPIRRVFYMHHIVSPRGAHAHPDTDQVIIAAAGEFRADLFDGREIQNYQLDNPRRGLFVPRMLWVTMDGFSEGCVALVLASTHYDNSKTIRSREAFVEAVR